MPGGADARGLDRALHVPDSQPVGEDVANRSDEVLAGKAHVAQDPAILPPGVVLESELTGLVAHFEAHVVGPRDEALAAYPSERGDVQGLARERFKSFGVHHGVTPSLLREPEPSPA